MPTPSEILIAAAEACEVAAQAHESADAAINAANEQKSKAAEKAQELISQARRTTRNEGVGLGPRVTVTSGRSPDLIEAERYKHIANDCRQMAEVFKQG